MIDELVSNLLTRNIAPVQIPTFFHTKESTSSVTVATSSGDKAVVSKGKLSDHSHNGDLKYVTIPILEFMDSIDPVVAEEQSQLLFELNVRLSVPDPQILEAAFSDLDQKVLNAMDPSALLLHNGEIIQVIFLVLKPYSLSLDYNRSYKRGLWATSIKSAAFVARQGCRKNFGTKTSPDI